MNQNHFSYSSHDSNENDDFGTASSVATSESDGIVDYQLLSNTENNDELDTQMKAMPLKEYKILMNLIPENQKLRNTIIKLERQIELKDSQLKEERQTNRSKCIDLSHFSGVSIYIYSHFLSHINFILTAEFR